MRQGERGIRGELRQGKRGIREEGEAGGEGQQAGVETREGKRLPDGEGDRGDCS